MSDADRPTGAPPTVSVVVPAHNAAATLADALRSALSQEPPPLEIVVVDDGSTDATIEVARAAAPAAAGRGCELRVLSQPQAGPSAARNRGIEQARGEWVAFLDADDVWRPDKWAVQWRAVADRPDVVAVAADWVRHDDAFDTAGAGAAGAGAAGADATARVRRDGAAGDGASGTATGPAVVPVTVVTERALLELNRFQTSTVVARADVVGKVGGFDPDLDGVEDWDMWRRLAAHGPILKVDLPLVAYTDQTEGYSKDLVRVYRTALRMLDRALAPLPRHERRRLRAWHHLRFAVAFALAGDRPMARQCLADLRAAGVLGAAPAAAARHLAPFLAGRVRRRAAG